MKSAWVERDAQALIDKYAADGVAPALALRVYTTRLLGRDPKLVLHGGGNTSLKAKARDLTGADVDILYVKGSGWDMGVIEPAGFPAVWLDALQRLRGRDTLSDDDFVRVQQGYRLDPLTPVPSVEMLLHAFMPAPFVDHTHATAILSIVDQPNGEALCAEVFGGRLGFVPYSRPGFGLARLAASAFDKNPNVEGLILDKHGIFTFGDSAREAYERMIDFVTLAEAQVAKNRKSFAAAALPAKVASVADVAPVLRGACALPDYYGEGAHKRLILDFRTSDAIRAFVDGKDVARYARAGVETPDHVIRTKPWPLIVPPPQADNIAAFEQATRSATKDFIAAYTAYFEAHKTRSPGAAMHDPAPRVALVPGLGLFGMGASAKDAAIAADMAEAAVECITGAEGIGRYAPVAEADMFDCEYWPPELAKLGKRKVLPLAGQVAVITGGGGAIGTACARAFAATGAEIALLDRDEKAARDKAAQIGPHALALACDVTDATSVTVAFTEIAARFGGVDILISNAGAAWQGKIGDVDEAVLRQSFDLNFFAHQKVAQAAVKIMLKQGTGGCLLFNVSKQAVNPGPNFGPYGLPKAATLFLVRQYALDYGADGIRANAVNADRIRSGLLTDDFIKERAKARGLTEKDYMSGNLLQREVTADDVAQAFLAQALALKTTADVTTVDGGNIAAALR